MRTRIAIPVVLAVVWMLMPLAASANLEEDQAPLAPGTVPGLQAVEDGALADAVVFTNGITLTLPNLQISKDDGLTGAVLPGQVLTYTVTYTNTVGASGATGVVISDTLALGTSPVYFTQTVPAGTAAVTAGSVGPWDCTLGAGAPIYTCVADIGDVDNGSGGQLALPVIVDSTLPAGTEEIVNQVVVDSIEDDQDPGDNSATETTPVSETPVEIDIKPGNEPNPVKCDHDNQIIPVAILTGPGFDATTVDHETVLFEGAAEFHTRPGGIVQRHEKDVDGDGDIDLVFHFRLGETSLDCSSTGGELTGATFGGQPISGSDSVLMIP